ncbi:hypothetical protein CDAR_204811 [Caerostris darwini]|uniref:Uncharacterized protein n=1 Tax=Caerostris darwini TaxID=1538125 RepID=A0AAV4PDP2_9ARAC|nr:hypothetical protein CDAR_204811 [Caerostris darwini]
MNMVCGPPAGRLTTGMVSGQVRGTEPSLTWRVSIAGTPLAPGHFKYSCCHGDGRAGGKSVAGSNRRWRGWGKGGSHVIVA